MQQSFNLPFTIIKFKFHEHTCILRPFFPHSTQNTMSPCSFYPQVVCVCGVHLWGVGVDSLVLDKLLHTGLISSIILSPDVPRVSWELREPADQPCTADAGGKNQPEPRENVGTISTSPSRDVAGFLFEPEMLKWKNKKKAKRECRIQKKKNPLI